MGELDDALRDEQRQASHTEALNAWNTDFGGGGTPTFPSECPHSDILADTISRLPSSAYTYGYAIADPDNRRQFLADASSVGAEMPDDWRGKRRLAAVMRRRKKTGAGARWFLLRSRPELDGAPLAVNVSIVVLDNGAIRTTAVGPVQWGGRVEFARACAYAIEKANSTRKQLTDQFGGAYSYG
jgi:hypothetical protein